MAAKIQILNIAAQANGRLDVLFNIVLTGSYVAGGDIIDFTQAIKDPNFWGISEVIESSLAPASLDCWDAGGNLLNEVGAVKGTSQANCKIKLGAASTYGTEFSAGAYSAALLAATIQGQAVFAKLL